MQELDCNLSGNFNEQIGVQLYQLGEKACVVGKAWQQDSLHCIPLAQLLLKACIEGRSLACHVCNQCTTFGTTTRFYRKVLVAAEIRNLAFARHFIM